MNSFDPDQDLIKEELKVVQKPPTLSFTEAVRNLGLDQLQGIEIDSFSEAAEEGTTDSTWMTEYDVIQDYNEEYLEEFCLREIENTIEQYCGIPENVLFSDSEDEFWDQTVDKATLADYSVDIESPPLFDREPLADSSSALDRESYVDSLTVLERESYLDTFTTGEQELLKMQSTETSPTWEQSHGWFDPDNLISNEEKDNEPPMPHWMAESHLEGFGFKAQQEDFVGKRCLCRHFLKGRCNRGNSCDFLHDESIFCTDEQKVFLGGLPAHVTDNILRQTLITQGYTILNNPKVLQGFSPQICLGSVEEAQGMIRRGKIMVAGALVDVRPYEAFAKDSLKISTVDEVKRSVFMGGLPSSITGWMIKERLEQLGFKTVNHPVVKSGFAPQVMLASVLQARKLVKMLKIKINGTFVEIRPYSKYRV